MTKFISIYIYGAIIMLVGVFLFYSADIGFSSIRLIIGISLIVAALFAALPRQSKQVQFAYHELHALSMVVFGVSVLLFCDTQEKLIPFTAFILMFYSFSEIIFCNWLFKSKQSVVTKVLVLRLLLGLVVGVGTVIGMNFSSMTFEIFGALFILVGLNILFYVPVMKKTK